MTADGAAYDLLDRQLIALNATPNVTREGLYRLATDDDWLRGLGRGRASTPRVRSETLSAARRQLQDAEQVARREIESATAREVEIVTRRSPRYPSTLTELEPPPPILYIRGALPSAPAISMVGSRNSDRYGLDAAKLFARGLAAAGVTIVSGLAKGVDSASHRGALAAPNGRTVGVLGCGIDVVYPPGSGSLASEVARTGAVVSEFPMGTPPLPHHFPLRNRILAALSHGTLIVRARARSGTLITARLALELGREIYALPGDVFDTRSVGPNSLIRDGAIPVQHPREILESLPLDVQDRLDTPSSETTSETTSEPISETPPDERLAPIYDLLSQHGTASAEALTADSGRPFTEVLAQLTELEIGGWIERLPGSLFGVRR